eukprot:c21774_g1_i1 orf=108-1583(+)
MGSLSCLQEIRPLSFPSHEDFSRCCSSSSHISVFCDGVDSFPDVCHTFLDFRHLGSGSGALFGRKREHQDIRGFSKEKFLKRSFISMAGAECAPTCRNCKYTLRGYRYTSQVGYYSRSIRTGWRSSVFRGKGAIGNIEAESEWCSNGLPTGQIPVDGGLNGGTDSQINVDNAREHASRRATLVNVKVAEEEESENILDTTKSVAQGKRTHGAAKERTDSNFGTLLALFDRQCGQFDRKCIQQKDISDDELASTGKTKAFSVGNLYFPGSMQEERCLSAGELHNMKLMQKFDYTHCSSKGKLVVRALRIEQFEGTKAVLTDSFADLMWGFLSYRPLLSWIVGNYLRERQAFLPHAVTLVGLYAPSEENEVVGCVVDRSVSNWLLAGTVEISFNAKGQPGSLSTPPPPKDAPFLCNMAVRKNYRRRGIGWQLLMAAEELTLQMGQKEMYLHCQLADYAPLSMYKKAGYQIVKTDSILSLLAFQQRRYLMRKSL